MVFLPFLYSSFHSCISRRWVVKDGGVIVEEDDDVDICPFWRSPLYRDRLVQGESNLLCVEASLYYQIASMSR